MHALYDEFSCVCTRTRRRCIARHSSSKKRGEPIQPSVEQFWTNLKFLNLWSDMQPLFELESCVVAGHFWDFCPFRSSKRISEIHRIDKTCGNHGFSEYKKLVGRFSKLWNSKHHDCKWTMTDQWSYATARQWCKTSKTIVILTYNSGEVMSTNKTLQLKFNELWKLLSAADTPLWRYQSI